MTPIIVIGAGGHARVVADVIRLSGEFELRGFLDTKRSDRHEEPFEGSRVLGGDELIDELRDNVVNTAFVAIGDNVARTRIGEDLLQRGFELAVLVHPSAVVAPGVSLAPGTLLCAGTIINPGAVIGKHAIINTAASVDHDCQIGAGVHIAPGAHLGGHVTVGAGTLIGLGASIKPGVTIGERAVVGVGAAVVNDVADEQTVVGVPARVAK